MLPVEMLVLKGGRYGFRSEPTQTACEDIGGYSRAEIPIRTLRQTLSTSSALSPHLRLTFLLLIRSAHILHIFTVTIYLLLDYSPLSCFRQPLRNLLDFTCPNLSQ